METVSSAKIRPYAYRQQEAISQKEIVFRFPKDIQSEKKAGVLISGVLEVPGWRGFMLMLCFICLTDPLSWQSVGFIVGVLN